ncbi:hypothetical protein ECN1_3038 [Escherichia coli N1]|nr:hypothetical protein ECN1_3038 [Escherichia coli N1]
MCGSREHITALAVVSTFLLRQPNNEQKPPARHNPEDF